MCLFPEIFYTSDSLFPIDDFSGGVWCLRRDSVGKVGYLARRRPGFVLFRMYYPQSMKSTDTLS